MAPDQGLYYLHKIYYKLFNPLYTGRRFHCFILDELTFHLRGVKSSITFILVLMENPGSKHCKP